MEISIAEMKEFKKYAQLKENATEFNHGIQDKKGNSKNSTVSTLIQKNTHKNQHEDTKNITTISSSEEIFDINNTTDIPITPEIGAAVLASLSGK